MPNPPTNPKLKALPDAGDSGDMTPSEEVASSAIAAVDRVLARQQAKNPNALHGYGILGAVLLSAFTAFMQAVTPASKPTVDVEAFSQVQKVEAAEVDALKAEVERWHNAKLKVDRAIARELRLIAQKEGVEVISALDDLANGEEE